MLAQHLPAARRTFIGAMGAMNRCERQGLKMFQVNSRFVEA